MTGVQTCALPISQGEADIGGIEYSKYVYPYTREGASVDMAFSKEGAFAGVNCQVLVKGGPNQDIGIAFMNYMLDPAVQKPLAEASLAAPPVDGKANEALIAFLAERLDIAPSSIEIRAGASGRQKRVLLRRCPAHDVAARLGIATNASEA